MDSSFAEFISNFANSPVKNYVIPGLTSSLLGAPSEHGTVRLFECSRDHQEVITPHSHRFNFTCLVLQGSVTNRVWYPDEKGDPYRTVYLKYCNKIGSHEKTLGEVQNWVFEDEMYFEDDTYSMKASDVHSIWFSKGTKVLFFEGPQISDTSCCIEPVIDGTMVETMTVQPWMFQKG